MLLTKAFVVLLTLTSCTCRTTQQSPASHTAASSTLDNFIFLCEQVYPQAAPTRNSTALVKYLSSSDFKRHKSSATAYFNASEMNEADARLVLENRDPVNIAMHTSYDAAKLQELLTSLYSQGLIHTPIVVDQTFHNGGLRNSAYSKGLHLASMPGVSFSSKPHSVCVYSETFLWPRWNGSEEEKKEVAVVSVPAPALDSVAQPNYAYYVQDDVLNQSRYEAEMRYLATSIVRAFKDHAKEAFNGKGLKRLVLTRFGQASFIAALTVSQKEVAHRIFARVLSDTIAKAQLNAEVVMLVYGDDVPAAEKNFYQEARIKVIVGDILSHAKDQDLLVNAWDPHSLPGNGNDADNSLDGILGRATAILLTQSPYFNEVIRYVGVAR